MAAIMTGRRENWQIRKCKLFFSDYHSIIAQHHCLTDAFIAFNYCVIVGKLLLIRLWWRSCTTKFQIQQSARSDRIEMF